MFKPFFYAVCGAAGFGLSFIIGIFSGAAFAVILLRALAFGAAFAALAFLFHFILNRFVPDLFGESPAPQAASPVSSLDITIDGEDDSFLEEGSDVPDFMKSADRSEGAENAEAKARGENPERDASAGENGGGGGSFHEAGEEGMGELPDARDFETVADFEGESDEAASGISPSLKPPFSQDRDIFASSNADAGVMAKAIRTVLSKE